MPIEPEQTELSSVRVKQEREEPTRVCGGCQERKLLISALRKTAKSSHLGRLFTKLDSSGHRVPAIKKKFQPQVSGLEEDDDIIRVDRQASFDEPTFEPVVNVQDMRSSGHNFYQNNFNYGTNNYILPP